MPITGRAGGGTLARQASARPVVEYPYPKVHVDTELTVDSPAAALVEASARAGLVVLPRHPVEGRLGLHLGTVVHAVLHHARCPVAVVPTGQAAVAGVHVVRRRPDGAADRPPARLTSRRASACRTRGERAAWAL
ncbi:universal stress protein [Streptomyces gossypiisoli]|uniref:universal stress protein n=1 Tax=Streptomyces gossypiisoli TaxID=2748864 RepID=UPI0038CD54EC